MDLPVEATVHVARFRAAALRLLRSHGFQVTDVGGGQVRVRGVFQKLRAVSDGLERLNGTAEGPSSSSRTGSPPGPVTLRPGGPVFVVDTDVFRYAERFRNKDLDAILLGVTMTTRDSEGSTSIALQGRNSEVAGRDLQRLLQDLNQSLRTQEVPLTDARRHGAALLDQIRKTHVSGPVLSGPVLSGPVPSGPVPSGPVPSGPVLSGPVLSGPVLVSETGNGLHLVGPSRESYELKQRLLGKPVHQSGRRVRSQSPPPTNRRRLEGGGATADDGQQGAAAPRRRSLSEPRRKEKKKKKGLISFITKRFNRTSVQKKDK